MDMKVEYYLRSAFIVLLMLLCVLPSFAQQAAGALRGQVTDPSGAAISGRQRHYDSGCGLADRRPE